MELLDGVDLEELVREEGPQPPARVAHVLRQVCGSLAEAHELGLIHRDIKPANVILTRRWGRADVVKVVDFGLVKDLEADPATGLTAENTLTGTPLYLAPEAIRSAQGVGVPSDIYAVGALGYFLLTGQPVFSGESVVEVCGHHLHTTPTPPSERLGHPVPEVARGGDPELSGEGSDGPPSASAGALLEQLERPAGGARVDAGRGPRAVGAAGRALRAARRPVPGTVDNGAPETVSSARRRGSPTGARTAADSTRKEPGGSSRRRGRA